PVAKVSWVAKLGVLAPAGVVLNSTDVLEFPLTTTKSGLPSPSTSATAADWASLTSARFCWGAKLGEVAPATGVLSSTDTVSEPTATRSGMPSPLKSAARTRIGEVPAAKVREGAKLGVLAPDGVVLSSTHTRPLLGSAATRSGLPSPLKS